MRRNWVKRAAIVVLALILVGPLLAFVASNAATGTAKSNSAFVMTFSKDLRNLLILNNRTAATVYFKINDAATPTCSATVYDVALSSNTVQVIGRDLLADYPVQRVGVFCADSTPTLRLVGW